MGRMGEPDEIAKAALFLASDDSSFVAGTVEDLNGGVGLFKPQTVLLRRGRPSVGKNIHLARARRLQEWF
jgi:hypothetical protein